MEHELKDITAVVNHKGGVAKTSTVLSLAGGLLRENRDLRVLVIDMDSQCNLSMLCGWEQDDKNPRPTIYDALCVNGEGRGIPVYKSEHGYYYTPASSDLSGIELDLRKQSIPEGVLFDRLGRQIDDHTGDGLKDIYSFDYVLIDCPPELSDTTSNAIVAASRVLIPVLLTPLAYTGLSSIIKKQTKLDVGLRRLLNGKDYETQDICIVPTITEANTRIARKYFNRIQEVFGKYISKTRIRKDVKMGESQGEMTDIFHYAPYCHAAIDYEMLIKELYS